MNVLGIHTNYHNLDTIKNSIGYHVTPLYHVEYYSLGQELACLIDDCKPTLLDNLNNLLHITHYESHQDAVCEQIIGMYNMLICLDPYYAINYIREVIDEYYPNLVYKLASKHISKSYETLTVITNVNSDEDFNFVKSYKYGVMLSHEKAYIKRWFDYETNELNLANNLYSLANKLKIINYR